MPLQTVDRTSVSVEQESVRGIDWQRPCPPRVDSITELIGNTPLLRLFHIEQDCPGVELWAKCEFTNPAGSVKDRAAFRMIQHAIDQQLLQPGVRLLDSTSGNTGIAYAMVGATLGIPVTLVMPANASEPRKLVSRAYGAELIFSDPMQGSDGAIVLAHEIFKNNPGKYYYPDQYGNLNNPGAHYSGTAEEIWSQTQGRISHFVTGIGTSGTVTGTSRRLHELSKSIQCIAVQPDDAMHGLEGLKHLPSSIVPEVYDESVVDDTLWLPTEDGWDMAERLSKEEGLCVGYSSGGNVAAALQVGKQISAAEKTGVVVTILCDRGDRYFVPLQWEKHYRW